MNELRFMEIIGGIGDDLIRDADAEPAPRIRRTVPAGKICALGSLAAAAVIAVGAAAYFGARQSATPLRSESVMQTEQTAQSDTPAQTLQTEPDSRAETDAPAAASVTEPKHTARQTAGSGTAHTTVTQSEVRTEQSAPQTTGAQKGGMAEAVYLKPFPAAADPDADAFVGDVVHQVCVRTADGVYRQLAAEEYAANSVPETVSESDFGAYIGRITEVNDSDYHANAAESQEPALTGADVYFYAPTGKNKAFIIVKKGSQCSLFFSDGIDVSAGIAKGLTFFDVQNADDIQSITYRRILPADGGRTDTAEEKTLTDPAVIEGIYALLCELHPEDYSKLPPHIGTPQWLVDAWEAYRADPNPPPQETYSITLRLKDGTVLQAPEWQPFLGNGYVTGMQELTPEQNRRLRAFLQ